MRFFFRVYQTLQPEPDGRVFGELTFFHICDDTTGGAAAYNLHMGGSRCCIPSRL